MFHGIIKMNIHIYACVLTLIVYRLAIAFQRAHRLFRIPEVLTECPDYGADQHRPIEDRGPSHSISMSLPENM